jgi:hypothetical protein
MHSINGKWNDENMEKTLRVECQITLNLNTFIFIFSINLLYVKLTDGGIVSSPFTKRQLFTARRTKETHATNSVKPGVESVSTAATRAEMRLSICF